MTLYGLNSYEIVFWGCVSIISYVYFGYPVVLKLFSPLFGFSPERDEAYTPGVSLLILAYNEEESIGKRLDNALEMHYPRNKFEIIVVSNGSTDGTDEIAKGYEDRGVRLISYKKAGKTNAQNLAIPHANGEIVVFSDANTIYRHDAIRNMIRYFVDNRIGLVCGRLSYIVSSNNLVGKGEGLYWGYDGLLKVLESRLGSCLVVNGSIFAFRKELYEPIDTNLTEDFVLPIRILKKGFKNVFEPDAIAFEKTAEKGHEEFNRKVRIITQGSRSFFAILRELPFRKVLIIFEMASHKLLRWLAGLFLLLMLVSNLFLLQDNLYLALFVLQVMFYAFALLGYLLDMTRVKVRFLFIPYYFCLVNIAALTGITKMLFGAKMPTWQKAKSTR